MIDQPLETIQNHLQNLTAPTLWFADENAQPLIEFIHSDDNLTIVTNRFDIYQQATTKKIRVIYSDFNPSDYPDIAFQKIIYRISKEKALVHHLINQAITLLTGSACLILSGYKQEGIKSYADKLKKVIKAQGTLKKNGSCYAGEFSKLLKDSSLDEKNYSTLQKVVVKTKNETDINYFYSKPGVFGWNKIDKGTELLLQTLNRLIKSKEIKAKTVLDLGCGYGWIFLNIDQYNFEQIMATDNNATAIIAAQKNAIAMKTPTTVVESDCANTITDLFDLVLCNPPFHQGFQHNQALTEKFITSCHQKNKKKGHVLIVTNEFVSFDNISKKLFSHKKTLLKEQGFKVTLLSK